MGRGGPHNLKGAQTKYDPKTIPALVEKWASAGYTRAQICRKLNIARQTFYNWRNKYPDLKTASENAAADVDDKIEQKLFRRAMGFSYTETTRELVNGKMQITKKVSKKMPPDVVAMIFWLKNRRPKDWHDRKEIAHEGAIKLDFDKRIYEAVHGNAAGRKGGNGKPESADLDS